MQATKFKMVVEVEVLSLDTVPGLLVEIASIIRNENRAGSILKEDGDFCKWGASSERVDF